MKMYWLMSEEFVKLSVMLFVMLRKCILWIVGDVFKVWMFVVLVCVIVIFEMMVSGDWLVFVIEKMGCLLLCVLMIKVLLIFVLIIVRFWFVMNWMFFLLKMYLLSLIWLNVEVVRIVF